MIPFNKPYTSGNEINLIKQAIASGEIAGDGPFTRRCEAFFESKYHFAKTLLTSSCTDALELSAILIGINPGDEVIMPSYSFPSTGNAFILRGANIVFADSNPLNPNIDIDNVEQLITPNTRASVVVHDGGIACDMDRLITLANRHGLFVIEDAAQAIDSFYHDRPLGSFGHLAAFSFHETKNITCGEGGLLVINDKQLMERAEIIREKGTNRTAFMRKEISSYNWVDLGSSFLPSEITAAYLLAQLQDLDKVQAKRLAIWNKYRAAFADLAKSSAVKIPFIPAGLQHNGHVFYLLCNSFNECAAYKDFMTKNGVDTRRHYITLHDSPFYISKHNLGALPNAKRYQDTLVRLPVFYDISQTDTDQVINLTTQFFSRPAAS